MRTEFANVRGEMKTGFDDLKKLIIGQKDTRKSIGSTPPEYDEKLSQTFTSLYATKVSVYEGNIFTSGSLTEKNLEQKVNNSMNLDRLKELVKDEPDDKRPKTNDNKAVYITFVAKKSMEKAKTL